jgi:hypothetical protein
MRRYEKRVERRKLNAENVDGEENLAILAATEYNTLHSFGKDTCSSISKNSEKLKINNYNVLKEAHRGDENEAIDSANSWNLQINLQAMLKKKYTLMKQRVEGSLMDIDTEKHAEEGAIKFFESRDQEKRLRASYGVGFEIYGWDLSFTRP